jgi:lipopolysaccharide biosynthesis regulator YciM
MEGIGLIREVVEKDSTNTRAILQLGHFSVFSGQFPNAIKRYEQALRIDPTLTETYFFIGDTYAKMGDMEQAETYLRKYKDLQEGEEVKAQVEAYIEELKLKSNTKN